MTYTSGDVAKSVATLPCLAGVVVCGELAAPHIIGLGCGMIIIGVVLIGTIIHAMK